MVVMRGRAVMVTGGEDHLRRRDDDDGRRLVDYRRRVVVMVIMVVVVVGRRTVVVAGTVVMVRHVWSGMKLWAQVSEVNCGKKGPRASPCGSTERLFHYSLIALTLTVPIIGEFRNAGSQYGPQNNTIPETAGRRSPEVPS